MNCGKIIPRPECVLHEWVRRQITPRWAFSKEEFTLLTPSKTEVCPSADISFKEMSQGPYL